jgi:hypothetical protein
MPALSLDLAGPKSPAVCQACEATEDLVRWLEHDEADRPTNVVVVLCRRCSAEAIESHARLYRRMDLYEPHPGSMQVCTECVFRHGTGCGHPSLKANGGPGLPFRVPRPTVAFIDYRISSGRRSGHRETSYPAPAVCEGRQLGPREQP